jgi:hypothetical protein
LLLVASCILSYGSASVSASRGRQDDTKKQFFSSTMNQPITLQMKPSLAEKWTSIAQTTSDHDDFLDRLVQEEKAREVEATVASSSSKATRQINATFWALVSGSLLLLVTSHLQSGAVITNICKDLTSALSITLLPWFWYQGNLVQDLFLYVQAFARLDSVVYLKKAILPLTVSTMKRFVVLEFWRSFWGVITKAQVFPKRQSKKSEESSPWVSFLADATQRGTQKIVMSAIQKQLVNAASSVYNLAITIIQEQQTAG